MYFIFILIVTINKIYNFTSFLTINVLKTKNFVNQFYDPVD